MGLSSFTEAIITHEHPIYLHNTITQIILPSNQYNSLTHLHMSGFPSLQLLQFGLLLHILFAISIKSSFKIGFSLNKYLNIRIIVFKYCFTYR